LFAALVAAFVTVFVAEFGDKTQLVSLSMACRYPPQQVLAGTMLALALVLGLAVGVGGLIAAHVPDLLIAVVSGIFFLVMGLVTLAGREDVDWKRQPGKAGFYQTVILVFLAEMGDKTQMAAILLSASFGRPLEVFAGAMAAMLLNHTLAIFLGRRYFSRINPRLLRQGAAFLFIAIGLATMVISLLQSV